MARDDIPKLIQDAKKDLIKERSSFKSILKKDTAAFRKKALSSM